MPTEDQESASVPFPHSRSSLPPLVRITLKRRKLVGFATSVIMALSLAAGLLLPTCYTAATVILPPQNGESAGASMMGALGGLGGMAGIGANALGLKNPNDQQLAFLKSRTVEDAMIKRFDLQALYHCKYFSSARFAWEHNTSAESGLKDGLIRLKVNDRNAQRAALMANAWVD